ncbi:MAG: methyltransferase domain-containing protein [Gammaproteobacteria bacterium]
MRSYEKLKISRHDHILDVGCGPGIDVINLASRLGAEGRVTGLDLNWVMLREAADTVEQRRLGQYVSLVQGAADSLPFEDDHFDGVRSERLFMHLDRPRQVLSEMVRVTRPGGRIVIVDTDWCSVSIDTPYREVEWALAGYRIDRVLKNGYSGRGLYRLLRDQQLVDIEVELFPLCLTDIQLFDYLTMQQTIEDQALSDRIVTEQALNDWRNGLNQAARKGCFFSSATVVMVCGTKPRS